MEVSQGPFRWFFLLFHPSFIQQRGNPSQWRLSCQNKHNRDCSVVNVATPLLLHNSVVDSQLSALPPPKCPRSLCKVQSPGDPTETACGREWRFHPHLLPIPSQSRGSFCCDPRQLVIYHCLASSHSNISKTNCQIPSIFMDKTNLLSKGDCLCYTALASSARDS